MPILASAAGSPALQQALFPVIRWARGSQK